MDLLNNFEPQIEKPIDARTRVGFRADLNNPETWKANDDNIYIPYGIPITVYNDTSTNNGIYFLPNGKDYLLFESWVNISADKIYPSADIPNLYQSYIQEELIDTLDFLNIANLYDYEFLTIPGSYGVSFTTNPIKNLEDTDFNLKVDFISNRIGTEKKIYSYSYYKKRRNCS